MSKYKAVIHFDGGCAPNPGQKYGSYSIVFDDLFQLDVKRRQFGHGTNNEAEFEACLGALELLNKSCIKAAVNYKDVTVEIFTDSRVVFNWLRKFYSFKPSPKEDERRMAMYERAKKCMEILRAFSRFEIQWNSREVNVEKFGH